MRAGVAIFLSFVGLAVYGAATAGETSAERGRRALLERSFTPATMSRSAYDNVWKQWGVPEKPSDYDRQFRERYGLHRAPYPNDGLPMGLRLASLPLGLGKGISLDCLLCHGGSIA